MKITLERINDDFVFEGINQNGHKVLIDNTTKKEGTVEGVSPMQLLLMGLAGCSGIDIIHILKKQKIELDSFKVEVVGERDENEVPSIFQKINVKFSLEGDFSPHKAKRATELSFEKYCSVSKILEKSAELSYSVSLNGEEL